MLQKRRKFFFLRSQLKMRSLESWVIFNMTSINLIDTAKKFILGSLKRSLTLFPVRVQKELFFFLQKELRMRLSDKLVSDDDKVRTGIFAELNIDRRAISDKNFQLTHVIGNYEYVVQSLLTKFLPGTTRFIDIGCGCGFYTVGVARLAGIPAIGFDIDPVQISIAEGLGYANGVSSLVEHRLTETDNDYRDFFGLGDLVLIDIEGGEIALIERVPRNTLSGVVLIIECHDIGSRSSYQVAEYLKEEMAGTHNGRIMPEMLGVVDAIPLVDRNDQVFFAREQRRNYQYWLVLEPFARK
jgi:SAM-dependent methyltransferase